MSRQDPGVMWLFEFGIVPYLPMLQLQHELVAARQEKRIPDSLILLEHEPVITLGRRTHPENVLASSETLNSMGIEIHPIERGGDVTYHGPGQIVGYPIMGIRDRKMGASDYMHTLEEVLIRVLQDIGLDAQRVEDHIGVWIENRKIAALGARISKGVTYHGFALNIDPELDHFNLIVPCGIRDKGVTSAAVELKQSIDIARVRERLCYHFSEVFRVKLIRHDLPIDRLSDIDALISELSIYE